MKSNIILKKKVKNALSSYIIRWKENPNSKIFENNVIFFTFFWIFDRFVL